MRILAIALACLACAACTSAPEPAPQPPPASAAPAAKPAPERARSQLKLQLASGDYHCEQGQKLRVQRQGEREIQLTHRGNAYTLVRQRSSSGLPRFKSAQHDLVWIDLPWKGMLLNARTGRPMANECRPA